MTCGPAAAASKLQKNGTPVLPARCRSMAGACSSTGQELRGPESRVIGIVRAGGGANAGRDIESIRRSEEHTSELQSLMRSSYAVFCLKKKTHRRHTISD